ncbi:glutamine synthetase [Acrasis kona]|uniref:Glutamine synthetase n=1 Tax=Acrasis kona TaxID=1008807 RepID=A0AAW2ZB17_9EUKA
MALLAQRLKAIQDLTKKEPIASVGQLNPKVDEIFEEDVFGDAQIKAKLHRSTYEHFRKSLDTGAPLSREVADQIATAMKDWAISKGATHFTHWFQPLNGLTAEKHDSFINFVGSTYNRSLNMNFSGGQLIQGEPDASSFPSGGIRSTFEARGYTAWDMSSPSFIRSSPQGKWLVIPTAFCSWTGEALDLKTPLLKSNEAISRSTVRLLNLIRKDNKTTSAASSLGVEQEFFCIDRGFFEARPDLQMTGRTLLGAKPARGQEMDDHYFGHMDKRILSFIQDCEWSLWKLGVPVTTRHNEVAPSQYEIAPIFENISVASDHNLLTMQVLIDKAKEHGLAVLFHEKPFEGVNGSGKHHNWSIGTNTGENMIDPGHSPLENVQFLLFLAATIRSVSLFGDLLRVSIASPANDFRLGANEAPPAIISVYVGDLLAKVIDELTTQDAEEKGVDPNAVPRGPSHLQLGVTALPAIPKDQSDRNRTSSFAFTGNKFEFRAAGSSASPARSSMVINTIVAESIETICDEIEASLNKGEELSSILHSVVVKTLKEHKRAVFNGNGYTQEWVEEAARRGLPNLRSAPDAIKELLAEKNIQLFERMKVLSRTELTAHQTIYYEEYVKTINIEARCLHNIVVTSVLPAALEYKKTLKDALDVDIPVQAEYLKNMNDLITKLLEHSNQLKSSVQDAEEKFDDEQLHEHSIFMRDVILNKAMVNVRSVCDQLEEIVDNKLWPVAKYSEILYRK